MKIAMILAILVVSGIPFSYGNEAVVSEPADKMRTMDLDEYSKTNARQEKKVKDPEKGGWKNDRSAVLQKATEEDK